VKYKPFAHAAVISLAFGAAAPAGTLTPSLEQALNQEGMRGDVPVIVQFAEQVDRAALRAQANRVASQLYPADPRMRNEARRFLQRRVLVEALKDQSKASKKTVLAFLNAHRQSGEPRLLWARNAVAVDVPAALVGELAVQPGVESVRLDANIQGPGPSVSPSAPSYWNLDATGVRGLWELGYTGLGVVVASLDTGVDATHPDLGPKWRGGGNSWLDPYGGSLSPADTNGHGTQVMGLMVGGAALGYQIGMAPDAQWIAAKIFNDANQATLSGIHQAFQWVLDPDGNPATDDVPDIVNNSWALAGTVDQCNQEFAPDLALLSEADIAVVFAGGNYGPNPETSVSPANDPSVLAVGGVDSSLTVDIQSSRGPGACDGGIFPHLVAPGDGVLTADRVPVLYNVVSGTSFAVAHVAGGMAVLKSAFTAASSTQLRAALTSTALDLGDSGPDYTYGQGLLDLPAAYGWLSAEIGGGAGTLHLSSADYSVDENVSSLTVTVTRSGGSTGAVSVAYATGGGTATAGEDYVAASGTLTLADGQVNGSFAVTILDDGLVEGSEDLTVSLSNAAGGTLGSPETARIMILDDDVLDSDGDGISDAFDLCPNTVAGQAVGPNGCSANQLDADRDGFTADRDCDDGDATVYPGAPEIKHDGVDQDCNGLDLTIEVTAARYIAAQDKLVIWATSDLNAGAALRATIRLENGRRLGRILRWNGAKSRWQRTLMGIASTFGSPPSALTVYGPEGEQTMPVARR
jgi:serine protease AprX